MPTSYFRANGTNDTRCQRTIMHSPPTHIDIVRIHNGNHNIWLSSANSHRRHRRPAGRPQHRIGSTAPSHSISNNNTAEAASNDGSSTPSDTQDQLPNAGENDTLGPAAPVHAYPDPAGGAPSAGGQDVDHIRGQEVQALDRSLTSSTSSTSPVRRSARLAGHGAKKRSADEAELLTPTTASGAEGRKIARVAKVKGRD